MTDSLATPALRPAKAEFGGACDEVASVHRAAGVMPLSTCVIAMSGSDRVSYLHGVTSNDIRSLKPGQGCDTLLLSNKGKIQFMMTAFVSDGQIDIHVDESSLAGLTAALQSTVIMEDVTVRDASSEHFFLHIAGPAMPDILRALGLPLPAAGELSWIDHGGMRVIRRRRTVEQGVDVRVEAGRADDEFEKICAAVRASGGAPVGRVARDILRIEAGIPQFGVDILRDQLPQEAAVEDRAVSFTKGCYTGQEVVARIKTYGGVRRRLVGLIVGGSAPAPGDSLFQDGKDVGRVTSAARSLKISKAVALASVAAESGVPGARLNVTSADGPVASVVELGSPVSGGSPFLSSAAGG